MRGRIVIWHDEAALSVGLGEDGPAPDDLVEALQPSMRYTLKLRAPYGEQKDPTTGDYRKFIFKDETLYWFESPVPRFCCWPPYLAKIHDEAVKLGYEVVLNDVKFQGSPECKDPAIFEPDYERLFAKFTPRHESQIDCLAAIAANWYGRIKCTPGFGKTFLQGACGLMLPRAETILTVPDTTVMSQALEHVANFIPESQVGMVGGGHNNHQRFSIYTIQSLYAKMRNVRPDLLLVDEADRCVSDKWAEAVMTAGRRARIFGFSGSFERRHDNAQARYEAVFGSVIYEMDKQSAVKAGMVVPIKVIWHDVLMQKNPVEDVRDSTARFRWGIWRNKFRSDLVASIANQYPEEMPVLILVDKVEHAMEIARRLPDFLICCGDLSDKVHDKFIETNRVDPSRIYSTRKQKEALFPKFKSGECPKLIGTGNLGTGFSADALEVLIRCDAMQAARQSIQWPERTCRVNDATRKAFGIVHDFLDQFDEGFQDNGYRRQLDYDRQGFEQYLARNGQQLTFRKRKTVSY